MLADWITEPTGMRYPGGSLHDVLMAPFRDRLAGAKLLDLSPEAMSMAANVAMSKPSSVMAALPWVRLPAKRTWLEFSNLDMRQSMAALGSPNLQAPNAVVMVLRTGFLMEEKDGALVMDYVHTDRTKDGRTFSDMAPVRLVFDLDPERPTVEAAREVGAAPAGKGRVRRHFELISSDPAEAAAEAALRGRFSWHAHPDMESATAGFVAAKGEEFTANLMANQAMDAWRMFCGAILPGLILLNCRNAVAVEEVEPSAKLNRNRAAKGRVALRAHGTVKMALNTRRRINAAKAAARGSSAFFTPLVIGHFKVRKTGPFWWNPHVRIGRGGAAPAPARSTTLVG